MKISIITVAFNAATTIEAALESVAAQTHQDIEHIVIDGASTDNTLAIIQRYRNRLAHCVSEPDQGIYDAMNKGLRLASGEIIGFLNADDIYADPQVLERVASVMQEKDLDALLGDTDFVSPDQPSRSLRRYRSDRFRPDRIAWGWMPAHPAMFLRKRIYDQFGLFRTDYRIAGDFELVARMFHGDTLKYQHMPEVLVRMLTGGVSTQSWRNTLLLNREVLRACRENGISTNWPKILSKYPAKLIEFLQR
ncbi:MAG TPA: glycosyltransferase family 2 protein [Rhodocyclaceae bacterium]|jgi:glycosyltransferase involved in cell wall biosynthesis|nr:glycosyltransferase family 2 protein [Rhodocyclaceae bacterium]